MLVACNKPNDKMVNEQMGILALQKDAKTREEIMVILNLRGSGNFRANYLYPAIEQGYVAKLYPDSVTRTDQAYYLTAKGKDVLKSITL